MRYLYNMLLFCALMSVYCLCSTCTAGQQDEIKVILWYGQEQYVGQWGNTQRQINILGNIQGLDTTFRVYYTLNGRDEEVEITLGSDLHRLAMEGDFNMDIDRRELREGENHISLYIERRGKAVLVESVRVHYISGNTWPMPYLVDWSEVKRVQDAVEVVDGYWELTPAGVRIKQPYYDRVLAFGDSSWLEYEVETSVMFHDYIAPAEGPPTYNVSHVAIASRWPGHDQDSLQPDRKWFPLGATSEFRITDDYDSCRWRIFDGENFYVEQESTDYRTIQPDKEYRLKHRVENISDSLVRYSVKFWPADESEPELWDLQAHEKIQKKESGSALLLAHNTEVTFGNIYVSTVGE
jgi:hypothetical protein